MAIQLERPLTYDDLPQDEGDGSRYEIIGGELFVSPSSTTNHQFVVSMLHLVIGNIVAANGLGRVLPGPVDVRLGVHTVVVPDLVFVRTERLHIAKKALIEGAPDLIVEVASPSTQGRDNVQKAAAYAEAGVSEYWLPDPETKTFRVLALWDGIYRDVEPVEGKYRSTVIKGLAIGPEEVFADLR